MARALDNLSELIGRHLPPGMNREHLAKTIGVSPSTLSRWSARMPGPESLRALADVLDQPYGVVLAAALRSGGYAETTADILAGHSLTLVARDPACSQADEHDDESGAVFTNPDRAERWAHVRGELDARLADYGHGSTATATVVIDGASTPQHVVVYQASWDHRTDTVSVAESGVFADAPSGLDPQTAHVEALSATGKVFAVSATGTDADAARLTVGAAVSRLREDGQLLGTEEPTGLGFTDYLAHSELTRMRDQVQPFRGEPKIDPAARTRLAWLLPKLDEDAVPQPQYVWGGDSGSSTETEPWRDPISSYRIQPRDDERS